MFATFKLIVNLRREKKIKKNIWQRV